MIVIAVDCMGGDRGPGVIVEGAVRAARDRASRVILVGRDEEIRAELGRLKVGPGVPVRVQHASQVVEMHEHPGLAIRRKRDASVRVAFDLVKAGEASAVVSAGNSGAVMAAAIRTVRRIRGISRPAIATLFPTRKSDAVLIDSGANVEASPQHLAQFAVMGAEYARLVLRIERPRVGLLSNGAEDIKGTAATRETLALLRRTKMNFVGYVEGRDLFDPVADVVVCDGFVGNVVLKSCEGMLTAAMDMLKEEITSRREAVFGALLLRRALGAFRQKVHYESFGGAPLLGTGGVGIIAHGSSSAVAIKNAVHVAERVALQNLPQAIQEALAQEPELLEGRKSKRNGALELDREQGPTTSEDSAGDSEVGARDAAAPGGAEG